MRPRVRAFLVEKLPTTDEAKKYRALLYTHNGIAEFAVTVHYRQPISVAAHH